MQKITQFWSWFQDNETAIKNAFGIGVNAKEVFFHLTRNLNYVSRKISFIIKEPSSSNEKCHIIFTSEGERKLFAKLIELEEHAPKLEYFIPQAFIKPMQNTQHIKLGKDQTINYPNYKLKISALQILLIDYDYTKKQLKIKIFIPNYNEIKHFNELRSDIKYLLMEILGEINFKKHIKHFEIEQLPLNPYGLLNIVELPDYIDYLYKINILRKVKSN